MWIRALTDADASCGAKAIGLARLIAAGARVPEGFVVTSHAFNAALGELATVELTEVGHALEAAARRLETWEPPAELEREVRERAVVLGQLVVRSSAAIEDGGRHASPGVFRSIEVPADRVWDAIRGVWAGALSHLAIAYARRGGTPDLGALAMAVIVQRHVMGARLRVYTRPIGDPTGDTLAIETSIHGDRRRILPRSSSDPAAIAARSAEAAIAATAGADVELIAGDGALWTVQVRPIVHPLRRVRSAPPPIVLAALRADGRRWSFDVAHNPDPLSPAQQGLVARAAALGPHALAVAGGYLYTTPREEIAIAPLADRADFAARLAAIIAKLHAIDLDAAVDPETAVVRFAAFYTIWARELSPLIAAGKRPLLAQVDAAQAAALIGPRSVARDARMAPAWDVAVATFAERGDPIPPPARGLAAVTTASNPRLEREVLLASAAADAGELDVIWFARSQWQVRRALLERAATLRIDDAIFWIPLDTVTSGDSLDRDDVLRRAGAARTAHLRAMSWDLPLIVEGNLDVAVARGTALRGVGHGPRVVGRAVHFATLADARPVQRGEVVVTRAVTPALAMLVADASAIISETGGLLDHGAALARELGITCVVGCVDAWTQLVDGILVSVDGDAGIVESVGAEAVGE